MQEVKEGSVWQENDPRVTRFVTVVRVVNDSALVQTCSENGIVIGKRQAFAKLSRFNGNRSGYKFVRDSRASSN